MLALGGGKVAFGYASGVDGDLALVSDERQIIHRVIELRQAGAFVRHPRCRV